MKFSIFKFLVNYGKYDDYIEGLFRDITNNHNASVAFMNAHMIYEAHHDAVFHDQLLAFDYIFPDGMPLLYSLRWLGKIQSDRIAGNDVIFSLLTLANQNKWRVTFYGGSQTLLDEIKNKLQKDYPFVQSQLISPPFRTLSEQEDINYINLINEFAPHIILVGLGCPKQEKWIATHQSKLNAPMLGVGGAFSLFAGIDNRAPLWVRKLALEWVYRLFLEPKRLWKRYLVTNSYFLVLVLRSFTVRRQSH